MVNNILSKIFSRNIICIFILSFKDIFLCVFHNIDIIRTTEMHMPKPIISLIYIHWSILITAYWLIDCFVGSKFNIPMWRPLYYIYTYTYPIHTTCVYTYHCTYTYLHVYLYYYTCTYIHICAHIHMCICYRVFMCMHICSVIGLWTQTIPQKKRGA